jgi:hypothetical protein
MQAQKQNLFFLLCIVLAFTFSAIAEVTIPLVRIPTSPSHKRGKIPLGGGILSDGEYYANISVGSPAKYFTLQVDTGSTDMLIFSTGCSGCGSQTSTFFDTNQIQQSQVVACSSACQGGCTTFDSVTACKFDDRYGDGSEVSGVVVESTLKVSSLTSKNFQFGLIRMSSSGFENPPVTGIWGLASTTLSSWAAPSGIHRILGDNKQSYWFTMCLNSKGGSISFGKDISKDKNFQLADVPSNNPYYGIILQSITIKQTQLTTISYPTIVDSGTTLLYLSTDLYNSIKTVISENCGGCSSKLFVSLSCVPLSSSQIKAFPQITFKVQGVNSDLTIGSSEYLLDCGGGAYALGIVDAGTGPGTINILGDVFMQKFQVGFNADTLQVAFASSSKCSSNSASAFGVSFLVISFLLWISLF